MVTAIRPHPVADVSPLHAQTVTLGPGFNLGDAIERFHFGGGGGIARASVSSAQQRKFKADFCRELASLEAWSVWQHWLPSCPVDLQVFVSDEYRISRSLIPAWYGHRGRMEFPAWRVIAGEAAIMHELVHFYFPNGNRLLAEGLAVYLQAKIGGNPAFPNFGTPLDEAVREHLSEMVPEFTYGDLKSLAPIHLAGLDAIATPNPLTLSVGQSDYAEDPHEQARIYPIAGSFIQFLVDAYGMDKFRALFMRTPLTPLQCEAGSPERWIEVYGLSLTELEERWRSLILSRAPRPACHSRAVSGERNKAARSRPRLDKKAKPRTID
jgi:hypothetical protein